MNGGGAVLSGSAPGNNSNGPNSGIPPGAPKSGHLKLIEKLRGKNIVKIFAANGCEHVIALTSKKIKFQLFRQWKSLYFRIQCKGIARSRRY